jgi:hypothetical protein
MFHLLHLVLDSIEKVPNHRRCPGFGLRDISLTRLLVDYSSTTHLTPHYSESTMFNFLLFSILPRYSCCLM